MVRLQGEGIKEVSKARNVYQLLYSSPRLLALAVTGMTSDLKQMA